MVDEKEQRKDRLIEICKSLPETEVEGGSHLQFKVRKKSFAWYLDNHHGDGKIALCCKAAVGDQELLIQMDSARFYRPAYLGANGWIGIRIDTPTVDWGELRTFLVGAYKLVAPKRLVTEMASSAK